MFYQVERRTKESRGGLGIGLSLVRGLMELHGGRVEVHSPGPGKGSEFVLKLPRMATAEIVAARTDAPDASPSRTTSRHRVLVVDDNVDAADSFAMLLQLNGQDAQVAYEGPAALVLAEQEPPDIVFLDLGMPKMDGYEVARAFRSHPALKGVTLVALTGWGQPEDRQRTKDAGFDYHLVKPVEAESLYKLMAELD